MERQQQEEGLDTVEASVNKIPHKEVICVRHISPDFEQLLQIIKLTMDIPTHRHWGVYPLNIALLN